MGDRLAAVIDPGPDVEDHVRALVDVLEDRESVTVLVTHHHGDHAASAESVARRLGAEVWGPADVPGVTRVIEEGTAIFTDAGQLIAVEASGHSRHHLCFHWPERRALFAGDLVLGHGNTTWVAEYPGCVADYLASLDKIEELELDTMYPTHGPPLDAAEAIGRFREHRLVRIEQVRGAMTEHPQASASELLDVVYGSELPSAIRGAALRSFEALAEYIRNGYRPE